MTTDPVYVTITRKEYAELLREYNTLQQARAAGVDNWEGWMSWVDDDALEADEE